MRRRDVLGSLIGVAVTSGRAARAQPGKGPLIGLMRLAPGDPTDSFIPLFQSFMQQHGRSEGRNLRLLVVSAEGGGDRVLAASRELVAQNPYLIIVFGNPATRAVQQATNSIPIVSMVDDMLGSGLVGSMARPDGNTAGISIFASELDVKRLELLHETVPQAARIGVLADPSTISTRPQLEAAAARLGIELVIVSGANPEDAIGAADRLTGAGVSAVNVLASPVLATAHMAIIERLNRAALPTIYQWPSYAQDGGLLGYGPTFADCYRQVAALAELILKGAKPDELPIVQPTKFELAINLKTAKALGLAVPQSLLARADEVIE